MNKTVKRVYCCGVCGGPVGKGQNNGGLGKWRCILRRCTKAATSINKAGAMNRWTKDDKTFANASPVNTGQSPHAVVVVKLVKDEAA